ncbi:39S ribosomal protein L38, mitochondrial [Habropoda laboriosa]|uniref:Large ribosomal subunit protein mL38 n=1 Tax=Habropoda laboriosa TaxID=597456 RepID=A0A0L7QS30_9HYME|nr:PREDICTED: 39S ribosomal protein L38, mitochondrial [Habropoda laboriosa]KOC61450.1 39S ribosomal protein L38, mitochondrial [Habropoda laboriosa]
MANVALRIFTKDVPSRLAKIHLEHVRHGHHMRGKPPTVALSLKQRLELLNKVDPTTSFKVNIGFSTKKVSMEKKQIWMNERKVKRSDVNFVKQLNDKQQPSVNMEEVREAWLETNSPFHARRIADHYGIFQDLFEDAFFFPVVPLEIDYRIKDEDSFVRVHTGNIVKPAEACESPEVKYKAEKGSLWTLVMCTPDGNLENSNNEYCHWFLGNICENRVEECEQIMDYLRPIPARGVGYYRYIFTLYKQNQHLDYTEYKRVQQQQQQQPCLQLKERNWNTLEFYRKYQDHLTPAGLAFFQSDWDPTVKEFYHSALDTKEPIFQYDFPKPYVKPQTWFPLKESFNVYLDRYRDPKDVTKEFFLRKLRTVHPFKAPKPPLKYPNACSFDKGLPSWLKLEMRKERLGWGRVNDLK